MYVGRDLEYHMRSTEVGRLNNLGEKKEVLCKHKAVKNGVNVMESVEKIVKNRDVKESVEKEMKTNVMASVEMSMSKGVQESRWLLKGKLCCSIVYHIIMEINIYFLELLPT